MYREAKFVRFIAAVADIVSRLSQTDRACQVLNQALHRQGRNRLMR